MKLFLLVLLLPTVLGCSKYDENITVCDMQDRSFIFKNETFNVTSDEAIVLCREGCQLLHCYPKYYYSQTKSSLDFWTDYLQKGICKHV